MIKIAVTGYTGRMGSEAVRLVLNDENYELVGVLGHRHQHQNINEIAEFNTYDVPVYNEIETLFSEENFDVLIELTTPAVGYKHTKMALSHKVAPVVGTTGFTPEQIEELQTLAITNQTGGLIAPNFAVGAVLMMKFARMAAKYFPDVEITELHHDRKLDAPSGTAVKTAEMIAEVRPEHYQGNVDEEETMPGARGANYEGMRIHSVRLPGLIAHQEVLFGASGQGLTIRHDSYDRASFMSGVKLGVDHVVVNPGLVYGLDNILD
ncbi:4-hydroxy-tetrahydrodipicolinate reductase [Brochothrix thermosphacta]|uniref:4-hydroxy-tetrahydrodipicolinate reductase n=1 Tax=Brochothrix thermosphacta TaxID=2756 RepID=A0A2X0S7B4_BROTH|nr:4-hydroxy-tetrahydrodipicolinate reductase [Brochothrix thermosphacta]ODJ62616.1 4-hydroxy-tetrahydrodipicolinate reductase [Brochothrix thermosphacta]ODJ65267.1 4-hydroxy-tetrahydrodipicolinate reductase [Brochothrix thermosphacta]SPN71488.1 (4S)-4-hydroxy-2,3,4, 5-tetrahydro-(2S)-dipicolinic acid (HTPA) dehydratase reductase [Brochothrix thermosphacta]SPP28582.1 (4S)-4-hydroxy-2,3,4, 5-tetrahydro-(2S)-dipicolinic acid (HTPA) dehydratase reductase [Brochothrix thermosphacta]